MIDNGGYVFSLENSGPVFGVCALFKESSERFQLARMAVDPKMRGQGCGRILLEHSITHARSMGAKSIFLLSNTAMNAAISLYKSAGFKTLSEGRHPVYARCNIVMELQL